MNARALVLSFGFLFATTAGLSGCDEDCDPNVEVCDDVEPLSCVDSPEKSVLPSPTSVAECRSGVCGGSELTCEVSTDCIMPLSGDVVTWQRPQGGLGTRINVTLFGYPAEQAPYLELQTIIIQVQRDEAGEIVNEATLCDADNGYEFGVLPEGDQVCQRLIADQTNARFPVLCRDENVVAVEEAPIRFLNEWTLDDLDGAQVALYNRVEMRDGSENAGRADITLRVGEFVEPSWWETEGIIGERDAED